MNRALEEAQQHTQAEDFFSLNLDDPHSMRIIEEIEAIVSGEYPEDDDDEVEATSTVARKGQSIAIL